MEEGVTIAKVPDWMELKPEMMLHLIREHEKAGRKKRQSRCCAAWDSKSVRRSDEQLKANCYYHALSKSDSGQDLSHLSSGRSSLGSALPGGTY